MTKKAVEEAIEAGINPQPVQQDVPVKLEPANEDKPLTLEQVKDSITSINEEYRPASIRNVQCFEAQSKAGNPYIRVQWESKYHDVKTPEWRKKQGVIFTGQGKLVYDYLVEFGIDENETYIVNSEKVKDSEYSQWVSLCHIEAFDEAA